jgi:hypothetical protein
MVPSLTTILQRLTGEWAALLQPEAILAVCGEIGCTAWRDRVLTPVTTRAALPVADSAGQYRLQPFAPSIGLAVQCGGILSSSRQTPVAPIRPPPRTFWKRRAALRLERRPVARPPHVFGRRFGMLHARYPCSPGSVRPAVGAAAWVRLPRGAASGAVPCRHRCAPEAGGRTPPHPRSRSGAGRPSDITTRGCTGGSSGSVFLCPSRPSRAGWRACRIAPWARDRLWISRRVDPLSCRVCGGPQRLRASHILAGSPR